LARSKQILLVDDDPNDVELILTALAECALRDQVALAHDGIEALDYLHRRGQFESLPGGNPAVIFLDLKIPKMNGLEVLEHIRNDEDLGLIPVVVISSSDWERDRAESYRLGANAYVVKPVDFTEFVEKIKITGIFWAKINRIPT